MLRMLLGALRRLALLLFSAAGVTAAISALAGLAIGAGVSRSISVGLYLVGCFLLVAGFFIGNRGPARLRGSEADTGATAGMFGIGIGGRALRWATPDEREETLANSAVFVTLGFLLIVLGFVADTRVSVF